MDQPIHPQRPRPPRQRPPRQRPPPRPRQLRQPQQRPQLQPRPQPYPHSCATMEITVAAAIHATTANRSVAVHRVGSCWKMIKHALHILI